MASFTRFYLAHIYFIGNKKLSLQITTKRVLGLFGAEGSCLDKEQTRKIIEISRDELIKRIA